MVQSVVNEEGKKLLDAKGNVTYDYSKIEELFDSLGIEEKRLYPDELIQYKIDKIQNTRKKEWLDMNPDKEEFVNKGARDEPWKIGIGTIDTKNTHKNIMNAYHKAYVNRIREKLATGRYDLVARNRQEIVESVKTIDLLRYENALNNKTYNRAEIINDFVNSDLSSLNKVIDDVYEKGLSDNYTIVDWRTLSDNEVIRHVDEGSYLMPKRAVKNFEEMSKTQFKENKKEFLKVINFIQSVFKAGSLLTTKFHITNLVGNTVRSYIELGKEAFNPVRTIQATQILNGKKLSSKINNGMTYKEVLERFEELGGKQTNAMREYTDRLKLIDEKGYEEAMSKKSKRFDKFNILDTENFLLYKASSKVGEQIEGNARMTNFVYHLENGKTPQEAMDLTNKILFDYSDLTTFEQSTLKTLFPFYTFVRKNVASQMDMLANNPKEAHLVKMMFDSAENRQSDEEKSLAPSYLTNGSIPLGNKQYLQIGLPFLSSVDALNPKTVVSSSTPLIKAPIEVLANRRFYNDSKVSEFNDGLEKFEYLASSIIPLLSQGRNLMEANRPTLNTDGTDDFKKTLAKQRISKQWLGNIVGTYDEDMARKSALDAYADKLNQQYYELITNNPAYAEEENKQKEAKAKKALQDYIEYRSGKTSSKAYYHSKYNDDIIK